MVSMPYRWQKGHEWQMLEWVLSVPDPPTRLRHKRAVWKSLFDEVPLADLLGKLGQAEGQTVADANPTDDVDKGKDKAAGWATHLIEDWYGLDRRKATPDRWENPTGGTGWWAGWEGQPIDVVKQAMLRALQVSLGDVRPTKDCAQDDLDGPDDWARNWPIEVWWICPVGTFQASVVWRRHPPDPTCPDTGVVSVTWMTPGQVPSKDVWKEEGVGENPDEDLENDPPVGDCLCAGLRGDLKVICGCQKPVTDSVLEPVLAACAHLKRRGSWIVGQRFTRTAAEPVRKTSQALGKGFKAPNALLKSSGQVVTVEPSWPDGGVNEAAHWGRY